MLLFELGNTELPSEHKSGTYHGMPTDFYEFTSKSGNEIILRIFNIADFSAAPNYLNVRGSGIGIDFDNTSASDVQGITGTGDQNEILSTVHNIIGTEIKQKNPQFIGLGAHEASRQSLYERWLKLIARQFGYKILPPDEYLTDIHDNIMGTAKFYLLQKK